ncbi:TPA: SIR2 family protein [Vibrio vulnificus]|nr:SIR2 family protein [Vibrio vulnificus]HEB2775437.1 SIR2 family protein [Vibrio vulnificus]
MADILREMPELDPEIITAAKEGSLVLFIGAGISRLVGHQSWDGFAYGVVEQLLNNKVINHYEKEMINTLSDPRKRLSIAKILDEENENGTQVDYQKIFTLSKENSGIYKSINEFGCTFVTTNYDKLIVPEISKDKSEDQWRYFERKDLLSANLDQKGAVVHIHGCIDEPSSMVITTKDYLNHYTSGEVHEFLQKLFLNKTVLFLGYGLEETEILEYVLKSSNQAGCLETKLFILQGFFQAEQLLFDKLNKYYRKSFNAKLIGFLRDHENYEQQKSIIEKWVKQLDFGGASLAEQLAELDSDLS